MWAGMLHVFLNLEIGRIPQGYSAIRWQINKRAGMLLIYSTSKFKKVPLMELGHQKSPKIRFLGSHLEGLLLISLSMNTHTHTHTPQTCVTNTDHIKNGCIWWKISNRNFQSTIIFIIKSLCSYI